CSTTSCRSTHRPRRCTAQPSAPRAGEPPASPNSSHPDVALTSTARSTPEPDRRQGHFATPRRERPALPIKSAPPGPLFLFPRNGQFTEIANRQPVISITFTLVAYCNLLALLSLIFEAETNSTGTRETHDCHRQPKAGSGKARPACVLRTTLGTSRRELASPRCGWPQPGRLKPPAPTPRSTTRTQNSWPKGRTRK